MTTKYRISHYNHKTQQFCSETEITIHDVNDRKETIALGIAYPKIGIAWERISAATLLRDGGYRIRHNDGSDTCWKPS